MKTIKKILGAIFAPDGYQTEAQRRISVLAQTAVDRSDLDRKMRENGLGGL